MSAIYIHTTATTIELKHYHFYCGLGAAAKGFNKGHARVGQMRAKFRCIGGVDNNPAAIRDFARMAGVKGTNLDMFSRAQYAAFHGHEPPADWREATKDDIRASAGGEYPDIIFLSAPCKGNSGLLAESMAKTAKYQALNGLLTRTVDLMMEAWGDNPPSLIIMENVPRIAQRSRALVDEVFAKLRAYGYAGAETTHDCGEIGNLAQTRKRWLAVFRYIPKVPNFLYEPPKRRLRGVGEVLDKLPLPGDLRVSPMHRMPSLQWKTWVRLAFVEAGSDWRSLNKLQVADGVLADFGIVPDREWNRGALGVKPWSDHGSTITANGRPASGAFSVADPRIEGHPQSVQMGVGRWSRTGPTITSKMVAGGGRHSVADPRPGYGPNTHQNVFRIVPWSKSAGSVTAAGHAAGGALSVADPRAPERDGYKTTKYRVTKFEGEPAGSVIGASTTGNGAFAIADPRGVQEADKQQGNWRVEGWNEESRAVTGNRKSGAAAVADPRYKAFGSHTNKMRVVDVDGPSPVVTGSDRVGSGAMSVADPRWMESRETYKSQPYYGVLPWEGTSGAIQAASQHDNGRWSVADPRETASIEMTGLPAAEQRLVAVIRALDDTWHRPFTTYELAALQGLFDPEEQFELDGLSDAAWRERIGNAVPPPAAEAVAGVMGRTLLLAMAGETFQLSAEPIWVQPVAIGLMAAQGEFQ